MWSKTSLKILDRVAIDMAEPYVDRWRTRGATCEPPLHGVALASVAHAALQQRHVDITIVIVVEAGAFRVRVHHADFDNVSFLLFS